MNKQYYRLLTVLTAVLVLASCARLNIKDGLQAYEEYRYTDAIHNFSKGLNKIDDPEARRALAEAYFETNQYNRSKEAYELLSTDASFDDSDRMNYGRVMMAQDKYEEAETIFAGILSRDPNNTVAESLRNSCKKASEIKRDSTSYEVTPIFTSGVASAYSPHISNGKIYFSGARDAGGAKDHYTGLNYTDLYVADIDGANFRTPTKVEGVNGKFHDGIASISPDGNTMVLTRSNYGTRGRLEMNESQVNTMQLYITTKDEDNKWVEPQLMPFSNDKFMYAHPAFSSDGKTLYFASDMSGGYGGMDLYKSTLENETWSTPVNLGSTINTPGNELFPSLRSDDSLYFSSNSHQTLGGLDILYSVQRNGSWSSPTHLPYPVNTRFDDFGMAFTGDGTAGYFSSDRLGRDNIYSFISHDIYFNLSGLITRKFDDTPIEGATVTIKNLTDATERVISSDDLGTFEDLLIAGKNYQVRVEKDGFFAINESISTRDLAADRDIKLTLEMVDISNPNPDQVTQLDPNQKGPDNKNGDTKNGDTKNGDTDPAGSFPKGISANNPYKVPDILWDYDKATVREDARPYLDYVAKLLRDNPELKVEVSSHADSRGSNEYNDQLSDRRANAVSEYLVKKGVRRSMLISRGYGERKLLNNCTDGVECSEAQHQVNRRTEFTVIGQ